MAPLWSAIYQGESDDWASLCAHADQSCARCHGTGAESVERDQRPQVNFANANAYIIAHALGIDLGCGVGAMDLPTLRRGLLRARNVATPDELRADETTGRVTVRGYTRADLDRALTSLQELVDAAQRLGTRRILWQ